MIGSVLIPLRGRVETATLDVDGVWHAEVDDLAQALNLLAPPDSNVVAAGPFGWPQLQRGARLLGGTAAPLGGLAPAGACDGQPRRPDQAAFAEDMEMPEAAIKVRLGRLRQQKKYSCGAVALEVVARLYTVGGDGTGEQGGADERWFEKHLGTTASTGTPPPRMLKLAEQLGLQPEAKQGWTQADVIHFLEAGLPMICLVQAWGSPQLYANDGSGHYIVACGYDDHHCYFSDPSMRRAWGYLLWDQFDARWHDEDTGGRAYRHWGLVAHPPRERAAAIG